MKSISNLHLFPRAARTLLLMVAITLTALAAGAQEPTTQFPTTSGGAGTAESPYLITSIDDLNKLAADVNSGTNYSGKYFRLENDLNYSGVAVDGGGSNFTPIGWAINSSNEPNDFQGNFDGGNHTISGVKVVDNTHYNCGLFGIVTNGTIKNLKVTNISFQCSDPNAKVGGIVGSADNSTVENCHTTSDVSVTGYDTGGIVGNMENSAKVIACTSAAAVEGAYVGGILGYYNPGGGSGFELKYCFYYGSSVTVPSNVGSGYGYGALNGGSGTDPVDCYYQSSVKGAYMGEDMKTSQHGYIITLEDGIAMSGYDTEADRTITLPSGDILKIYSDGYEYLDKRYFRYGATVTLSDDQTFDDGYMPGGYVNTDGAMGPKVNGNAGSQNYSSVLSGNTLTMGTCNVTISMASKTPITYNITYNLAGGMVTTANPATYNIETETFTLKAPLKAGYTFAGWTGTGLTEATMTVTIPKGSLGDRTYTATWAAPSGSWSDHVATSFATINTSAKTLSIASVAEMALFAKDITTYADYTVTLTANLDLKAHSWKPIVGFNGTFVGQGHKISGVMIESTAENQGLFGTIGTAATVKNLVIANSYISGGNNTGAVVGMADGNIENCHVMESVTITGTEGANYGGIAGYSGGSIIACSSAAMMSAQGNNTAGIVGSGYKIDQCLYYGTILPSDRGGTVWAIADGSVGCTNYQTYNATTTSHKFVRVYDADPGIMGTVTKEYSNTGYKVYEKGVSYGGKFYTAVVALTEDGITDLTAYAGQTIDVAFRRSFTKDVASTVCLPFAIDATQAAAAGKFYTFAGVDKTGSEWEVIMQEANKAASLAANTPYLFMPAATGPVLFYGEVSATVSAGETSDGEGWTFRGTYEKRQWDDTHNTDEIGRIYGFAAQDATSTTESGSHDIQAGNFIRIAGGPNSYALPFRAYLKYEPEPQNAPRRTASELPATMKVRLVSNIGGTTAVTEMRNKELGKRNDGWFTLDGRKLDGKPSAKGVYINNGRKTVIK